VATTAVSAALSSSGLPPWLVAVVLIVGVVTTGCVRIACRYLRMDPKLVDSLTRRRAVKQLLRRRRRLEQEQLEALVNHLSSQASAEPDQRDRSALQEPRIPARHKPRKRRRRPAR
jgi:hypothetical protein